MINYLPIILSFIISFCRIDIGILLIVLNLSTIGISFMYYTIPTLGGIQIADAAICGIALNLLVKNLDKKTQPTNNEVMPIWMIVGWFLFIAIAHGLLGQGGINSAYNIFVRTGMLWIIPIAMIHASAENRRLIIFYLLGASIFVALCQAYALWGNDPSFVVSAYYQFENIEFYQNPENIIKSYFDSAKLLRILPNGAMMVQMCLIYLIVIALIKNNLKKLKYVLGVTIIVFVVFLLSLNMRSAIISLFIVLSIQIYYVLKKGSLSVFKIWAYGMIILLCCVFLDVVAGLPIIENLVDRFSQDIFSYELRMNDNLGALLEIIRSPIIGLGKITIGMEVRQLGLNSLGYDVHSILSVGLLGGIPLLIFVTIFLIKLFSIIIHFMQVDDVQNKYLTISASFALTYSLVLSLLNTGNVLTSPKDMVPFLVFVGFVLGEYNTIA